jgi:hypothetical protein
VAGNFSDKLTHVNCASRKTYRLRAAVVLARSKPMLDLILVAGALAAFAVTIGYAYACDQL